VNCYLSSHFEMDCYGFLHIMLLIKFVLHMVGILEQLDGKAEAVHSQVV